MYKIVKRVGGVVGYCDNVRYIVRDPESGMFFRAVGEEDADGVAYRGVVYNFTDEEKIPDAEFVFITEFDGGEYLYNDKEKTDENSDELDEVEDLLMEQDNANAELQDELDTAETLLLEQDNELCLMQEALMELDNQIKGRTTK